jgi:hypothetical protein
VRAAAVEDLSVAWISRLPKIDYVWGSQKPRREGWPSRGDSVTWVAHVRNLTGRELPEVTYRWLVDGEVARSATVKVHRRRVTELELPWTWDGRRHEIVFEIDPLDSIAEIEERNNRLLIHTDALAVGFWVEKRLWRRMQSTLQAAGIGATTFEDWMQLRVRQFNEMAALARYPGAPRGVLDRWRIDAIHVVGNRRLPLSPLGPEVRDWGADPSTYPTLYPDTGDRSVDMEWGFPASSTWFEDSDAWSLLYDSLVHELGHARYLIDVYAWDLTLQDDIVEMYPPPPTDRQGRFYTSPEAGMMHHGWGYIDRYSAMALNRIQGHRATQGHYNEPANIGVFLNDLPKKTRLRPVAPDGRAFPGSQVRLYRASSERNPDWMSHPYQLRFGTEPDLVLAADGGGTVELGPNPFADEPVRIEVDRNNALAIVEVVEDEITRHWGFLEARVLNIAYWRGQQTTAEIDLPVDAPICPSGGIGPDLVTPGHNRLVSSRDVTFEWPPLGDRVGLWTSVDGKKPRRTVPAEGAGSATKSFPTGERVAWWLTYTPSYFPEGCPAVRSSTFYFDLP